MSAQDFVDQLNFKIFPQMGYVQVHRDGGLYWEDGVSSYPANESTRRKCRNEP